MVEERYSSSGVEVSSISGGIVPVGKVTVDELSVDCGVDSAKCSGDCDGLNVVVSKVSLNTGVVSGEECSSVIVVDSLV